MDLWCCQHNSYEHKFVVILGQIFGHTLLPSFKDVNPCSNMGGIILGRNIQPACGIYCAARGAKRRAFIGGFGGMLPREYF